MSLWTPGGEHSVPREPAQPSGPEAGGPSGATGGAAGDTVSDADLFAALPPEVRSQLAALSPEERAQAEAQLREMLEVQQQMAQTPAAVIVANHAMGMYELATIHLRVQPPNFAEAQVAIDGFAALVGALQGKLGDDESTLVDALAQIRLAFVQLKAAVEGADPAAADLDGPDASDA